MSNFAVYRETIKYTLAQLFPILSYSPTVLDQVASRQAAALQTIVQWPPSLLWIPPGAIMMDVQSRCMGLMLNWLQQSLYHALAILDWFDPNLSWMASAAQYSLIPQYTELYNDLYTEALGHCNELPYPYQETPVLYSDQQCEVVLTGDGSLYTTSRESEAYREQNVPAALPTPIATAETVISQITSVSSEEQNADKDTGGQCVEPPPPGVEPDACGTAASRTGKPTALWFMSTYPLSPSSDISPEEPHTTLDKAAEDRGDESNNPPQEGAVINPIVPSGKPLIPPSAKSESKGFKTDYSAHIPTDGVRIKEEISSYAIINSNSSLSKREPHLIDVKPETYQNDLNNNCEHVCKKIKLEPGTNLACE